MSNKRIIAGGIAAVAVAVIVVILAFTTTSEDQLSDTQPDITPALVVSNDLPIIVDFSTNRNDDAISIITNEIIPDHLEKETRPFKRFGYAVLGPSIGDHLHSGAGHLTGYFISVNPENYNINDFQVDLLIVVKDIDSEDYFCIDFLQSLPESQVSIDENKIISKIPTDSAGFISLTDRASSFIMIEDGPCETQWSIKFLNTIN